MPNSTGFDRSSVTRHLIAFSCWAVLSAFAGGVAFQTLRAQSNNNEKLSAENKEKIKTLDDKLDKVHINQAAMQEQLKGAATDNARLQITMDAVLRAVTTTSD